MRAHIHPFTQAHTLFIVNVFVFLSALFRLSVFKILNKKQNWEWQEKFGIVVIVTAPKCSRCTITHHLRQRF